MCLPIHVDEVPEYEVRGDAMLIRWRGLEVYVPIPICLASMGRCQRALEEWHKRDGSVLPFRVAAE